jgi:hypothetical protein
MLFSGDADAAENRLNQRHKDDGAEYDGEEEEVQLKDQVGIQDGDDIGLQDDLPEEDDSEVEDEEDLDNQVEEDKNIERDRISVSFVFSLSTNELSISGSHQVAQPNLQLQVRFEEPSLVHRHL